MVKSLKITECKEMYDFLVFLLAKYFQDIPINKISEELNIYNITGICECISDENDACHGVCCGTFYVNSASEEQGIFITDDYYLFSSNLGIFIFHTDSKGHLKECEFFYEKDYFPKFYLDIVKFFKNESEYDSYLKFIKVNSIKLCSLTELKNSFKQEKMNIIEIE
ncbi:hypothetical protein OWM07_01920 [Deferribacter thermophilus]|uniref:hypothetical protein n=1 Tax=Deferribacter thermophilus TaxID=53573 RepID=UPI003C27D559